MLARNKNTLFNRSAQNLTSAYLYYTMMIWLLSQAEKLAASALTTDFIEANNTVYKLETNPLTTGIAEGRQAILNGDCGPLTIVNASTETFQEIWRRTDMSNEPPTFSEQLVALLSRSMNSSSLPELESCIETSLAYRIPIAAYILLAMMGAACVGVIGISATYKGYHACCRHEGRKSDEQQADEKKSLLPANRA